MIMPQDGPFDGIFGKSKELEILQFMISEPNGFYNISSLSGILGIHRDTVTRIIAKFKMHNMVELQPGRGRSKCYRLNGSSKIVKSLDILSVAFIDEKVGGTDIFETTLESFLPFIKDSNPTPDTIAEKSFYPPNSLKWASDYNSDFPPIEMACSSLWTKNVKGGF